MFKHIVPVFRRKVGAVKFYPECVCNRLGVGEVGFGGTVIGAVILLVLFIEFVGEFGLAEPIFLPRESLEKRADLLRIDLT